LPRLGHGHFHPNPFQLTHILPFDAVQSSC
jgi:hypothetical protein